MKQYEMKDHLGSVRAVVSDVLKPADTNTDGTLDELTADVLSAQDYFAFGQILTGRSYVSGDGYRFGYNYGSEKDNEINGVTGSLYTTEFRELDTRIGGRWWTIDPIVKPWESPYAGFSNNPIYFSDPKGLDSESRARKYASKHGGTVSKREGLEGSKMAGKTYFSVDGLAVNGVGTASKVFKGSVLADIGEFIMDAAKVLGGDLMGNAIDTWQGNGSYSNLHGENFVKDDASSSNGSAIKGNPSRNMDVTYMPGSIAGSVGSLGTKGIPHIFTKAQDFSEVASRQFELFDMGETLVDGMGSLIKSPSAKSVEKATNKVAAEAMAPYSIREYVAYDLSGNQYVKQVLNTGSIRYVFSSMYGSKEIKEPAEGLEFRRTK